MRMRPIVAGSGILIAGLVGLTHLDRLRSIPANLRRYSMPSAATYDLATRLVYGRRYDEIAAAIAAEAPAGGAVLDVGSGSGEVMLRLARRVPTLRLTGVDVDPGMLAVAERKAARLPAASRPTFVAADAASLPMDDASVDLVVSSFAAHHLPDRHAALAEMMRVLKPGGRVIIWDIASPVAARGGPDDAHAGGTHGPHQDASTPAHAAHSLLGTLRMMIRFGRLPAARYEFAKPAG